MKAKKWISALLAAVTMLFAGSVTAGAEEAASAETPSYKVYYTPAEYVGDENDPYTANVASAKGYDQCIITGISDEEMNWFTKGWNDHAIDLRIDFDFITSENAYLSYCNLLFTQKEASDNLGGDKALVSPAFDIGKMGFALDASKIPNKAKEKLKQVRTCTVSINLIDPKTIKYSNYYLGDKAGSFECEFIYNDGTQNLEDATNEQINEEDTNSKKETPTTGELPKTAKKGTSLPEYTIEGYYISKNKYQIVLGGIPAKEYAYLEACNTYFNGKGHTYIYIESTPFRSLNDCFHVSTSIGGGFYDDASLIFDWKSDSVLGKRTIEKNGDFYTCTFTFELNSAAKKAVKKQIQKTETGKMQVCICYDAPSENYARYNYYNLTNNTYPTVSYNFSDEIKDISPSATEITLKKTTLTAKKSGEKITLSWKKVDGAEKYQIYYREKGSSKYKKLTTVSESKTSYSTSKLDKNKIYQFKIRSYVESNGKKYYSGYSKVVTTK